MQDFHALGLPQALHTALARMQFTTPTPIQAAAIPPALAGKDILGTAQTGTGKTGAFGIPLVTHLMNAPRGSALVLTPTRELATQVMDTLKKLVNGHKAIKTALLIGGESMGKQFQQLKARPRLVVGTPGRVIDHLHRGNLMLRDTGFLVLDETDRMLDMGFGIQLEKIVRFIPAQRQTLMFSATLPDNIIKMSEKYLQLPARISVGSTTAPIAKIHQETVRLADAEKYPRLLSELTARDGSIIVFVKTKWGADRLADKLSRQDHLAEAIHGDLSQNKRERVIRAFRSRKSRILVATDIAARGLDISHVAHVINYDLPQCPEDYIHRIGRTGRAGAEGQAISLVAPADAPKWKAILRLLNPKAATSDKGKPRAGKTNRSHKQKNGKTFRFKRRKYGEPSPDRKAA
ncbi:MAG: DEAD/DEAH box helicase [Alphaproteobacteria bacterium]